MTHGIQMTTRELRDAARRYHKQATEFASWVCLNPANAAIWRAEAAKCRALAAAAEVDLAITEHAITRKSAAYERYR